MSYTPPTGNALTFNLIEGAYSAPTVNSVDFSFVESFTSTFASILESTTASVVATYTLPPTPKTPLRLEDGRLKQFGQRNVVPVQHGGTGADTASDALSALGGSPASHTHTTSDIGAADSIHTHNSADLTDITNNANSYLRRNTDNTAYEAKTSAEVLTDIGAAAVDHTHTPAILARQIYTATAGQIDFNIAHEVGYVEVFLNGVKLVSGSDFTDPDTTKISLVEGARLGDTVELVAFGTFQVADHYTKTESDTLLTGKLSDTSDVVTDAHVGNRTVDDTQVPSGDIGLLGVILSWFGNVIKSITGKASWRTAPATTLEVANAHHNNTANPHAITKAQVGLGNVVDALQWHADNDGAGSGLDADLLDGNEASAFLLNIEITKTANTYLRRNSANGAYESKTPLQVADELIAVRDWRGRNVLINGDFRVWPEGTSFTTTLTRYAAEGWLYYPGGGTPSSTISRQSFVVGQVDVPGEPEFFLRIAQTAAATTIEPSFGQRIEGVRTLAGQTVTRSVWLRVQSGTLSLVPQIKQHCGTGGSPSSDVTVAQSVITVTTVWQRFVIPFDVPSIAGKTLGSFGNDYLELAFRPPLSQTFTLDIADAQLEPGPVATPFERRSIGEVLALCQRYYQKSYQQGHIPGAVITSGSTHWINGVSSTFQSGFSDTFAVVMRASNPTIIMYSPDTGASGRVRNATTNADMTVIAIGFGGDRIVGTPSLSAAPAATDILRCHWTADARL